MTRSAFLVYLILVWSSLCSAEVVFVSLPANRTVVEGEDANFTCSVTVNGSPDPVQWQLRGGEDNIDQRIQRMPANIPGLQSVELTEPHRSPIILNNVSRSLDGLFVSCLGENQAGIIIEQPDPPAVLGVFYAPVYTASTDPTTILEGTNFSYSFQFTANPLPDSFTWTKNRQAINNGRVAVSVSGLAITGTVRDDSGVYQVTSSNAAGVGSASFTLNVQYPPEYADTEPVQLTQLMVGAPFTLNCMPSAANPPVNTVSIEVNGSSVISGNTVTVADNVLTISSVQRSHSGNYSCNATNTRGSAVIYQYLLVVGPPSAPRDVTVSDMRPFTAQLTWTAPEDDGGVSNPSWDPSLDSRENRPYLTYTVTLTNGTVTTMATTQALSLNLSFLQHSTRYSVTVEAENVYGSGPVGNASFNTTDSVPIIDSVSAMALSLSAVQVNITLLTDGGQRVNASTVEIRGVNYTGIVEGSDQSWVSVLVNQLDQNFTKGENHTVRVFTTNSVGTSNPRSTEFQVPFPPNTTAPPTELSTTNIPVCCAGVQLNLANPDDPIDVSVLVDGTPHPANQVTRNGSFLYIMGLQAGTEYSLNITLSNIFGTVWINTTVRPLLGNASTPEVAVTPTAGGLTVQLTVMYPGTREDTLQYFISMSPSPLSRRQTGQQPLPVADLTTSTSGSAEVPHGPGTYSVTVTVTNQHGSTTSEPEEVVIPEPSTSVDTAVIIGVVVAVVIVILLIILAVFIVVLFCMKRRDTKAMYKSKSEGSGDADYKEMVDTYSTDPLAPQYEDPSTLERQAPPPVVTYKKEEEAAAVQPAPAASGLVYADLDFSRQQAFGSKKPEKKKPDPIETVVYSEVRLMTPQETQQGEGDVGGEGAEPHSSTSIM